MQDQFNPMASKRFRSFMKLGSKEEQALKLLIMEGDVNRTLTYLECIDLKVDIAPRVLRVTHS